MQYFPFFFWELSLLWSEGMVSMWGSSCGDEHTERDREREKFSLWSLARMGLSAIDWSVKHGMACGTVTSFGSSSAGGAEAVCHCSLQASHTTVNKDYDNIMQMSAPSVHGSLVLEPALLLCILTVIGVLEATHSLTVQPCVDKAEGDRKSCSDKYRGI